MPDLPGPQVTLKPPMAGRAPVLARSLVAWAGRRPPEDRGPDALTMRHSPEFRQMVMVLTLTEIPLAFLVSEIIPPPARPFHAALELFLILFGFAVLATMARHPHTVSAQRVVLTTGFMGEVSLPRQSVRSASRAMRTVEGRGLRRVPNEPTALACSVGSSVNVCVHLEPPVPVDLGAEGTVDIRTVYVSADAPDALPRALTSNGSSR